MKQMRFWLKSLAIAGLTTTVTSNVIGCVDAGSQIGLPLAIANALGLTINDEPNTNLLVNKDNQWTIDASSLSLGNLLTSNAAEATPKTGCEDFIKTVLKIQPEKSGLYTRAKLIALDKFTSFDNINPIIALNDTNDDYNLVSGFFTIQFKQDSNTDLGSEYFVALKPVANFISTIFTKSFNINELSIKDFNIDQTKFKINQPVNNLALKVNDPITINNTDNDKKLTAMAALIQQNMSFSIKKINHQTTTWQANDSIELNLNLNEITIINFNIILKPSA